MKTNDEGINRRNIPVNFMDYIAQKHGYETFAEVPAKKITKVSEDIKHRFSQTEVNTRIAYGRSMIKVKRLPGETALDFVKRVDHLRYHPEVTEPRISGTVPGDKVLTGCPFDEPLPPIPGDAETLALSNLSPELVKNVAAELLELEKTAKHRVHDEYIYEVDDANRRRIEKLINLSLNYATPIFDLKTLNRSVADANLAMKKWREAFDALFNDPTTIARRYGQKILNAIPKKHAFAKGGYINETGPEQIMDRAGKTRIDPSDLKIETNQQWSPEELKEWLAKPEQQNRKTYVFREDRAQPGNTTQQRKPYFDPDLAKPYRQPVMTATSNDGLIWFDQIHIRNYAPDNWPPNAPPYHTPEGWEFEKSMKRRQLKSMLTIEWLEKQQTEKHALVAQRLREILAA